MVRGRWGGVGGGRREEETSEKIKNIALVQFLVPLTLKSRQSAFILLVVMQVLPKSK